MLTVPIFTPAGLRIVWSVRSVMSKPLRLSELLTRTRKKKNELSPGRGPGMVGGVTGHTVAIVEARQTFPTRLVACTDGMIPGAEYNPEIIESPISSKTKSFFKRALLPLNQEVFGRPEIYVLGRIRSCMLVSSSANTTLS